MLANMTFGPKIARWLAAMILAIIVLSPAVGTAHASHHHGAHATATASLTLTVQHVAAERAVSVALASTGRETVLRSDAAGLADICGVGGSCRCGAACCAPGILSTSTSLPAPGADNAVLRPGDASAHAGRGPESLTEPPRPLA